MRPWVLLQRVMNTIGASTRCNGYLLNRQANFYHQGVVKTCRSINRIRGRSSGSRVTPCGRSPVWGLLGRGSCVRGVRVYAAAASAPEEAAVAPKEAHGFTLMREEFVNEYNARFLLYRHEKSGAQLMSVITDDENKTFAAAFRTPISDSKGIPHILEHSMLGGSRKYDVKEPFVELLKGSLNTYLNAFTYPDRTLYPVASCNLQDFYNLVDVYLDAVLHPLCLSDPMIFQQEGWHHELESPEGSLSFKGVVFNEMKGVYSSPDSENFRKNMQSLFTDNNYRFDSGGDPQEIPNLTFEEFKNFHSTFYHPSNCKFWFYGNDPPVERLKILDEYLEEFQKQDVVSEVDKQPLMSQPKSLQDTYAASSEDSKSFVTLNWVLSEEIFETDEEIAMDFLNHLMMGTQASPLYKALTDSGLGEAVIGYGLENGFVQPFFSVGMKGVEPEDASKVEALIMDELKRLAEEGFSEPAIEAAVNTIEFSLRENNTGSFPRGLSLLTNMMSKWNYDQDPLEAIKWEAPLAKFKARLASREDIFKPLIQKYLLNNPHRVSFKMVGDTKKAAEVEETEKKILEEYQKSLSPKELSDIVEASLALKTRQSTPDPPEKLKKIPCLKLSDIPKETTKIPTVEEQSGDATFLSHDLFTNNILYLDVVLEMRAVPERLLPLLPLFCECLTQMGTEKESFVELTERIGRKVGGLSVSPSVGCQEGSREMVAKLCVQGKVTKDKVGDMTELIHDILTSTAFDDPQRFKQLALETKAGLEAGIVSSGNSFASSRLAAKLTKTGYVDEIMGGYSYLLFIRDLLDCVEKDWGSVLKDLEEIRAILVNRRGAIINLTGDESTLSSSRPQFEGLLDALPMVDAPHASWSSLLPGENEALTVPTQVNYIAKAVNLFDSRNYQYHGSASVVQNNLYTGWLWEKVRAIGGAYGCGMSIDSTTGNMTFVSFRDPGIMSTLDTYDATAEHLRNMDMDQDALTKTIIGAIQSIDKHQLPDAKGRTALTRHLMGITDEMRQIRRDQVLSTTVKDFHSLGEQMECLKDCGKIVAVTSPEAAKEILDEKPGFWDIKNVL